MSSIIPFKKIKSSRKRARTSSLDQDDTSDFIPPLDVNDLRSSWPEWRQQFQIYITANYHDATDRRKMALFLQHLGPAGLKLANSLLPSLMDFDSESAKKLSFEKDVWPVFNNHCTTALPEENFHETVKFYKITYDHDDITGFYEDLHNTLQGMCGIVCCRDRMIRDRFVQEIDDKDILAEVVLMKAPTSKEVLDKYIEIEKSQEVWPLIFPYLSTIDMLSLLSVSKRIDRIIRSYFTCKGLLTIDNHFLKRYPIKGHSGLYSKLEQLATNVALKNLSETEVFQLLAIFTKIEGLTLVQLEILKEFKIYPNTLKELKLIDCRIEQRFLETWFSELSCYRCSSLTLDNLQYNCYAGSKIEVGPLNISELEVLTSLTLIGDSLNIRGTFNELVYLKIVARQFQWSNFKMGNKVGRIYYYGSNTDLPHVPSLKFLTVRWCREMFFRSCTRLYFKDTLKSLLYLRILDPIDPMYKPFLDRMNKTDVQYYLPPRDDQPNLIFNKLNDDCLLRVVQYLTDDEYKSFAETNSRVDDMYARHRLSEVEVRDYWDRKFRNQTIEELPRMTYLAKIFRCIGVQSVFLQHLDKFTVLKDLALKRLDITEEMFGHLPVNLEKLKLGHCSIKDEDKFSTYLKQLNPTLRSLDWRPATDQQLILLQNIQEAVLVPSLEGDYLEKFLRQNKTTLERIDLLVNVDQHGWEKYVCIWDVIGSMEKLKTLRIWRSYDYRKVVDDYRYLFLKVAPRLKSLTMDVRPEFVKQISSVQWDLLEELSLCLLEGVFEIEDWKDIISLKELRKLHLSKRVSGEACRKIWTANTHGAFFMCLLSGLPKLTHLSIPDFKMTIVFARQVKEFLRENNRTLQVNLKQL